MGKLADAQAKTVAQLSNSLAQQLRSLWGGFTGWYDDVLVQALAYECETATAAAQKQARLLTDSYLQNDARLAGLGEVKGRDEPTGYPRFGVTRDTVWKRPAETYRFKVSQGSSRAEARDAALQRVRSIAEMEVALAQRDQTGVFGRRLAGKTPAGKTIGYRRIIHPERSKHGTCGLCAVAATRIYTLGDLMPIHQGCMCTVAVVTDRHDPGEQLNRLDLSQMYGKAGSTSAKDLSAVRIRTYTSGELGPVLTRGGVEIKDGQTRPKRELAPREKDNAVTGGDAEDASQPKPKDQLRRDLDLEISNLETFIESRGDDPRLGAAVENMRLLLHGKKRERVLLR